MDFEENRLKSLYLKQFECNKCKRRWWNGGQSSECNRCKVNGSKLPLEKTIGIGWFECKCGRRYAGFSQGDVTSKCHGCQTENLPQFIVPGDKADKDDNNTKKAHYCAACRGGHHCPIVEEARVFGGGNRLLGGRGRGHKKFC